MGRKTYDSIGRPLPNRTTLVVTRDRDLEIPGCTLVRSLEEALMKAKSLEKEEIFICGGGQIYEEALSSAGRLYLTLVHAIIEGDTFFPEYEEAFPKIVEREDTEEGEYKITYLTLEKS